MKSGYLLVIIIVVSAALGIGWFFDKRVTQPLTSSLQVPDNIDYYLSNLKYKSMNQQGSLHYLLQSPYLEHYIQQDTSHLQRPTIQFKGNGSVWFIQAETGLLQHKDEQFELQQQVELVRDSPQQPMLLTTDLMILKAQNNEIEIPTDMTVISSNLNLQANSAVLDLNKSLYRFKRVKAVYKPGRASLEQS